MEMVMIVTYTSYCEHVNIAKDMKRL